MKEPIRVLHVVRKLEQGGIQNFLMNVYRNINRGEIQFDFLVSDKGVFEDEIEKMGGKIYQIPYITDIGKKKYQKKLREFLQGHEEYKIIHSHLNQISNVVLEVAREVNIPIRIAHAHTMNNTNNFIIKAYKKILQRKICSNATHLFACSKEAAKWMFKRNSEKAIVIHNGIEIEKFVFSEQKRSEIRKQYNIDEDATVIGHIGRFSKVKNQEFLLEVFYEYKKINPHSLLFLVGDGETKEEIMKKANEMNIIDGVKFVGNKEDVQNYYSAFDIFVFPSLFEGLGIALIEAQTNGLKCIASDTIPKEVNVTKNVKFMSLNKSPKEWANSIKIEDRKNINLKFMKNYDIKHVSKELEKFYTKSIEKD